MLALARALMSHPRMLLLDEPSLGLAPLITREIFRIVSELNEKEGLTVLVVEQNAAIALEVASYAYVLEVGKVAVSGRARSSPATNPSARATWGISEWPSSSNRSSRGSPPARSSRRSRSRSS
jgi:branched-chain amino acid transport system ATP-binding protein